MNERKSWGSEGERQGPGPQSMAPEAHMAELSLPMPEIMPYSRVHGL